MPGLRPLRRAPPGNEGVEAYDELKGRTSCASMASVTRARRRPTQAPHAPRHVPLVYSEHKEHGTTNDKSDDTV